MQKLLEKSNVQDAITTADAAFTHQEIIETTIDQCSNFAINAHLG